MKGEAFVKLPRDLLESAAWRILRPQTRLFLEFLMIEHMRHGGKRNGFLLAPRRQLVVFGIDTHLISSVINEAEQLGVVDCKRGSGRRPSLYSLTWLPLSDGTEPSNRWRYCSARAAEITVSLRCGPLFRCRPGSPTLRCSIEAR